MLVSSDPNELLQSPKAAATRTHTLKKAEKKSMGWRRPLKINYRGLRWVFKVDLGPGTREDAVEEDAIVSTQR